MFAGIAPTYDLLNRLLSGSVDRGWRRAAARELLAAPTPERPLLLDLATGTGDLARELIRRAPGARVAGADFTGGMLRLARKKFGDAPHFWVEADGLRLPFADASFDACSVAFGLRNMADRRAALAEMRRVVRPGGRVLVLEFSTPSNPVVRAFYEWYSFSVMPRLGKWISGSDAYLYLPSSIREFPSAEALAEVMREAGLEEPRFRRLTFGVACIHVGRVGGAQAVQDSSARSNPASASPMGRAVVSPRS